MQPIPSVEELNTFFNSIGSGLSSSDAESALTRFDQTTPGTAQLAQTINQNTGVDALKGDVSKYRKSILDTENAIEGVKDSVLGRTSNSLVSQAQVDALTQKERNPLYQVLGTQSRNLENSNIDYQDAQTRADRLLGYTRDDIGTKRGSISGRLDLALNREAVNRQEAARQAELNRLSGVFDSLFQSINSTRNSINQSSQNVRNGINSANGVLNNRFPTLQSNAGNLNPTYNPQQTGNPQRTGSVSRGVSPLGISVKNLSVQNLPQQRASVTSTPSRGKVSVTSAPKSSGLSVTGIPRYNLLGVR